MSISSSIDKKTTALIKAQKYLQSAEQEIWIISKIADDFFRTGYNKKVKVKILTEEPKSAINHKIVKGTKIEIHRLEKISDTTLILIDKRVFLLFVPLKLSKEDIFLTIVTKGTTLVQTAIEMFLRLCSEIPAKR
jgi:thymidine kinase